MRNFSTLTLLFFFYGYFIAVGTLKNYDVDSYKSQIKFLSVKWSITSLSSKIYFK